MMLKEHSAAAPFVSLTVMRACVLPVFSPLNVAVPSLWENDTTLLSDMLEITARGSSSASSKYSDILKDAVFPAPFMPIFPIFLVITGTLFSATLYGTSREVFAPYLSSAIIVNKYSPAFDLDPLIETVILSFPLFCTVMASLFPFTTHEITVLSPSMSEDVYVLEEVRYAPTSKGESSDAVMTGG